MGTWASQITGGVGQYNPYKHFSHQRNAKAILSPKDAETSAKRQLYESKMDKQRLEHILFSGDPSGPLDQQKERMRETLKRRQEAQREKEKEEQRKKIQALPNGSSSN